MMRLLILTAVLLCGCAGPPVKMLHGVTEGGTPYTELVNSQDTPCMMNPACAQPGLGLIWSTHATSPDQRRHERGHIDEMRHGPWLGGQCSRVTVGDKTGRYKAGDLICFDSRGQESITRN